MSRGGNPQIGFPQSYANISEVGGDLTFGLGLGSRSERRIHISSFLALPIAEKCFPWSTEILLSRDIPNFYRGRTFSQEFWPSVSVWQFIPVLELIFAIRRNPIAKFQYFEVWQVLIFKFKFQNLVLWDLLVPNILLPKFRVFVYQTIFILISRLSSEVLILVL